MRYHFSWKNDIKQLQNNNDTALNPPYKMGGGRYHYYFFRCPLSFAQPDVNK